MNSLLLPPEQEINVKGTVFNIICIFYYKSTKKKKNWNLMYLNSFEELNTLLLLGARNQRARNSRQHYFWIFFCHKSGKSGT